MSHIRKLVDGHLKECPSEKIYVIVPAEQAKVVRALAKRIGCSEQQFLIHALNDAVDETMKALELLGKLPEEGEEL
jgi:hypothetical protein